MIRREHKAMLQTTGASFSDCEQYRYTLWRQWGTGPLVNFLMLNPSTADHLTNDPTIERCERRSVKLGYGGLIVTNLFALRATDPRVMKAHASPIGPDNDDAIRETASQCREVICAWGKDGKHLGRAVAVLAMLADFCPWKLRALKLSKDGSPWHPLYVSYDCQPMPLVTAQEKARTP